MQRMASQLWIPTFLSPKDLRFPSMRYPKLVHPHLDHRWFRRCVNVDMEQGRGFYRGAKHENHVKGMESVCCCYLVWMWLVQIPQVVALRPWALGQSWKLRWIEDLRDAKPHHAGGHCHGCNVQVQLLQSKYSIQYTWFFFNLQRLQRFILYTHKDPTQAFVSSIISCSSMTVIEGNFLAVANVRFERLRALQAGFLHWGVEESKKLTWESGLFHQAEWNISWSSWYVSLYIVYASDVHWGMLAALLRCIEPSLDVPGFTFDTPLSRCCVCFLIGGFFVNPDTGISGLGQALAWLLHGCGAIP